MMGRYCSSVSIRATCAAVGQLAVCSCRVANRYENPLAIFFKNYLPEVKKSIFSASLTFQAPMQTNWQHSTSDRLHTGFKPHVGCCGISRRCHA